MVVPKLHHAAENGVKLKGQSFVVRQPVTDELWEDAPRW